MSEQTVRAIYYPSLYLTIGETRFGSKKLLAPSNPYDKPLKNAKNLVRVDMLECLRNIWGDSILLNRENIYRLVSGDADDATYIKTLSRYYLSHAAFANYVSSIMLYGNRNEPFITRFTQETRKYLDSYVNKVDSEVFKYGGSKFLLHDHEYRYYAVVPACTLESVKGVKFIV